MLQAGMNQMGCREIRLKNQFRGCCLCITIPFTREQKEGNRKTKGKQRERRIVVKNNMLLNPALKRCKGKPFLKFALSCAKIFS